MPARFVVAWGPYKWLLKRTGFQAVTMPWKTIYLMADWFEDERLRSHELVHIAQMEREGTFLFCLKYLWFTLTKGYWRNPYEVEAYARSHPMVLRRADEQETSCPHLTTAEQDIRHA